MVKKTFLLTLVLFLSSNNILAHADKLTALRYKAMDEEMNKLTAQREKAMETALKDAAQRIAHKKERFFFTRNQDLGLNRAEKNLIKKA